MEGEHFYHPKMLHFHLASFVTSMLAIDDVTNAEHPTLLSVLQSFSTFWGSHLGMVKTERTREGKPYLCCCIYKPSDFLFLNSSGIFPKP